MSRKINFIVQSNMWRHPQQDSKGGKNVYIVKKFYYEKGDFYSFDYIKIGKQKEEDIRKLRESDLCIISVPEEQIEVEQWTANRKTYNALSFGNDTVIDKLTKKNGKIYFSYNSSHCPSSNELVFKRIVEVIKLEEEEEKWVLPAIKEIVISFPNKQEAYNKWKEFDFGNKNHCAVEGIDWERVMLTSETLKIMAFSKVGETFTEKGETGQTGDTPETETTGNTEQTDRETTGTGEENPLGSEEDNSKIREKFLSDLTSDDNRGGFEFMLTEHQVDLNNFKEEIRKLSKEEIKDFYLLSGKYISFSQLEEWIIANLENIKKKSGGGTSEEKETPKTKTPKGNPTPDLKALRTAAIEAIKSALASPEPQLTNSDLNSEHQSWENQINSADTPEIIETLKSNLLAHINAQRESKKTSEKVDENLKKAQDPNATFEDKKKALDDLDQEEGKQAYEEKKEETKKLKEEVAGNNPTKYRDNFLASLPNKITKHELTQEELDTETQTEIENLKNETDPHKIVEIEIKINQKLGQQGATKKIANFQKAVEKVLKSNNPAEIQQLKEQLINFINSNDIYYQAHKSQAETLLKQLEMSSTQKQNTVNPSSFPWKVVAPVVTLLGITLVALFIAFRAKKKKKTDTIIFQSAQLI